MDKGLRMAIFYERIEDEEKITIRYRNHIQFIIFMAVLIILANVLEHLFGMGAALICFSVIGVVPFAFLILFSIEISKNAAELKKAKDEGRLQESGSWFSLSNPRTATIWKA